jgi:lipopolysaccharide heptosyltransferase I
MNKFLIIRLSSLGDIIHTLPAFAALRSSHPDAEITWVVEESGREILELVPGLDRIVVVQAKQWRWHTKDFRKEISRILSEIRDRDQVAIDFQGLIKSGLITWLSRSGKRLGFHRADLREPLASIFYTHHGDRFPPDEHVILKNLSLLNSLGIREEGLAFPIELPQALQATVQAKLQPLGFNGGGRLVVINVGAAWDTKRWTADKWKAVIVGLNSPDIFPVLLWGTEPERLLAEEISSGSGIPLTPFLPLQEVLALLKAADLVVSGDTFALQAACALSRPVVAVFGPTDPRRNGPFSAEDKTVFHSLECSYCYQRTCPDLKCMAALKPEEVARLSRERLEEHANKN